MKKKLSKKIHLMTKEEVILELKRLSVKGKEESTYGKNLFNHFNNLVGKEVLK